MHPTIEANLPLAEQVIELVCRRKCQSLDEVEEFTSWARLRFLGDDGAIFKKFQGKSSLSTYLTTVVLNLFRDYRIEKWGKWRPSSKARRLGVTAVRLETLLWRDGISISEAIQILRCNFGSSESEGELREVAAMLPQRPPRRFVNEEEILDRGVIDGVEDRVRHREASITAIHIGRLLADELKQLPSEDRLILKLWAEDGFTVAGIAKTLGLDQKSLYRRLDRLKLQLRHRLESDGIHREEVREVIEWPGVALRIDYGVGETSSPHSSQQEERR